MPAAPYPESPRERGAWIVGLRSARARVDPRRPVGWFIEPERSAEGAVVPVLTVLLANRECPWKCVHCDLWRHTLEDGAMPGDVPEQIRVALRESGVVDGRTPARQIKLYNAGSFFDPGAIPVGDHDEIARLTRGFDRVIVECHPALVGDRVWRFRDRLAKSGETAARSGPSLEVALGLESADPEVLRRLNKGMTLESFRRSAEALGREGVAARAFVLVKPPFGKPGKTVSDAADAAEFAMLVGASAVSLIPTRPGNGALDALRESGQWTPPSLGELEAAHELALAWVGGRARVFADLWELAPFSQCDACFSLRRERLWRMNEDQRAQSRIACQRCGAWFRNSPV